MEQTNLNEVAVFARVVTHRSFSKAAASLGLPKSTVSRRVTSLERRLGAQLLQRTTRVVRLTDAGRLYYDRCVRILTDLEEADRAVQETQSDPSGSLRVTAPVDFGQGFLSAIVAEFLVDYPRVEVQLVLSNRTVDLVAEGIDLAFRASALGDSSLIARKLFTGRSFLQASPAYLRRRGTPQTVADLARHDCLVYGTDPNTVWQLRCGSARQKVKVRGRLCADDLAFLREAAVAGAGIGLFPEMIDAEERVGGELVRVLPDHRFDLRSLYLVYPGRRHLPARTRVFIDFSTERLRRRFDAFARSTPDR